MVVKVWEVIFLQGKFENFFWKIVIDIILRIFFFFLLYVVGFFILLGKFFKDYFKNSFQWKYDF